MDQHDLQNAKELIWNFHQKLDGAQISEIGDIIAAHTDENYIWRGYHPFNEIRGSKKIANLSKKFGAEVPFLRSKKLSIYIIKYKL